MIRNIRTGLVMMLSLVFVLIAGPHGSYMAKQPEAEKLVLKLDMTIQSKTPMPFHPPVDLYGLWIYRWSTLNDILWIKETLGKSSQRALRDAMVKKEPIGHCGGYKICYAVCNKTPNGDFEIICATPDAIGKDKMHEQEAVFSAIQVRIDKDGKVSGGLYTYARFFFYDNNFCKIQTDATPCCRVTGADVVTFMP